MAPDPKPDDRIAPGSSPVEHRDPRADSLGLGPEPTSFLHFSSWVYRNFRDPVAENLQHLVAWSEFERLTPEKWGILQNGEIEITWTSGLTSTVYSDSVIWREGAKEKTLRPGLFPDGFAPRAREAKLKNEKPGPPRTMPPSSSNPGASPRA